MATEDKTECITDIIEQMPAISDLCSFGCASPGPLGIKPGAVSGNDLDTGMVPEPGGYRSCVTIRQELKNATALKIADDCAVTLSLTPCPVIYTNHPWWFRRLEFRRLDHAQERVTAYGHGELVRQAGARFAANGKPNSQQALAASCRAAGSGANKVG